jgi:4-hydroxybenzoate polyprenyltransferase/phosphoserine phosphatase
MSKGISIRSVLAIMNRLFELAVSSSAINGGAPVILSAIDLPRASNEPSASLTATASVALPLCVDLDGTLVRSDTLAEGLVALVTTRHLVAVLLSRPVFDRASLKRRVAQAISFEPALLPYNEDLLTWLRVQKAGGRMLALVSAADVTLVRAVAEYLDLFDAIAGSDGVQNLKGQAKARTLVARFGEKRFAYAGDSLADLAVWKVAGSGVIVNASRKVRTAAYRLVTIEKEIDDRDSLANAILQTLRPYQWIKNTLVFVPIFTAHAATERAAWTAALTIFLAFCLTASAIYVVNDLTDLAADRTHLRKRFRPFARGAVSVQLGVIWALGLLVVGMALAVAVHTVAVLLLYAALSIAYSIKLKEKPLVDVFALAGLYTIRLFGGGEATGYRISLWLLACSSFLFLSLALAKRTGEMIAIATRGEPAYTRRGYSEGDIPILQTFGCCATFASSIVLALFVRSETAARSYASPALLCGIVPLLLFWQCRIWLATTRGALHDDPIVYAARDWVSWVVIGAMFTVLTVAQSINIIPT